MTQAFTNHLLQSTVFAAVAWMLTLYLRNNHARTRYWLWLTASVKFLIPFSLLVEIGHRLNWSDVPVVAQPRLAFIVGAIGQPFAAGNSNLPTPASAAPIVTADTAIIPALLPEIWVIGCVTVLVLWFVRWRRVAGVLRNAAPHCGTRELSAMRRLERHWGIDTETALLSTPAQIEPGVFGILRPVLFLPEGIVERLDDAQLDSVLTHELCHVRHRDNLTAALHMLVETIFWFHPLVWWIGARLVEERERACDEEVVRIGSDPELYAGTILQICKVYLASPLACAAGISGSNLSKRIERIMHLPLVRNLSFGKRLTLASAGLLAVISPVAIGILSAAAGRAQSLAMPTLPARESTRPVLTAQATAPSPRRLSTPAASLPKFESATVKPTSPFVVGRNIVGGPGTHYPDEFVSWGTTLYQLLDRAYVGQIDAITGPDWFISEKYDIEAKIPPGADLAQSIMMLQNLLAERFHLTLRRETQRFSGYALVSPLESTIGATPRLAYPPVPAPAASGRGPIAYSAAWLPGMDDVASPFDIASNGLRLIDRTGVPGAYEQFMSLPAMMRNLFSSDSDGAGFLLTVFPRAMSSSMRKVTDMPIEVLVVNRAEKVTTENQRQ